MMSLKRVQDELMISIGSYSAGFYARQPFEPGSSKVNYSAPIYDGAELKNLVECALSGHMAAGKWTIEFEAKMRKFFGSRDFLFVNSGSSANLLMVAALCAAGVEGHLKPGDEVITVALGFPTTLAPLLQHGLVPVFVDVDPETYNPTPETIEAAIGRKTRAVFLPHPLGLPFDLRAIMNICQRRGLVLIEDGCDALGAKFDGQLVGTFGVMSTLSFFPAHHATTGEGGGVVVNSSRYGKVARSIANWGKDCWCLPGVSDTCGKRFGWQLGDMPFGWDHKYGFSSIGFNLKPTDLQAALGSAQADKIPFIIQRRRENFRYLYEKLTSLGNIFLLPKIHPAAVPSPYAFPILVRPERASRDEVTRKLEAARIETRPIFAGNLLRQPAFKSIEHRVHENLDGTDRVMRDGFFVGVHPYLGEPEMDYIYENLKAAAA